jgi:hypothetical protein
MAGGSSGTDEPVPSGQGEGSASMGNAQLRQPVDDWAHTPEFTNTEGETSQRNRSTTATASPFAKTPVHLDPPPPVTLPAKTSAWSLGLGMNMKVSVVNKEEFCARVPRTQTYNMQVGMGMGISLLPVSAGASMSGTMKTKFVADRRYVVLGVMGNNESVPNEVMLPVKENLFKQIRKGMGKVRPLHRRLLSLKHVSGFAFYECVPNQGYHRVPDMDNETKRTMIEFWRDFRTLGTDYGDRWLDWVHTNFNNSSLDPKQGKFALQLVLQWSPLKLVVWGILPILLSLAVGFGYMFKPTPGEDFLIVVQTAWAIASYIVTAAACRSFNIDITKLLTLIIYFHSGTCRGSGDHSD